MLKKLFPGKFRFSDWRLSYYTTRQVRGFPVETTYAWGRLWSAFSLEYEDLIFFSGRAEIWYLNFKRIADTSDRLGQKMTVQRCSRSSMKSGANSVIYTVHLHAGTKLAQVEGELEHIWRLENREQKEIRVEDGTVWRSTLKDEV